MITTIFDYYVSDAQSVLIKASAKSVDKWAEDLRIYLPKGYIPPCDVYEEIEQIAINKLKESK